jgi:hypothetical protein
MDPESNQDSTQRQQGDPFFHRGKRSHTRMPLSFHAGAQDVKGFLNRFNKRDCGGWKEKPRVAGEGEPGRGYS